MLNRIKKILGLQKYQPLNLIEISKENLLDNYQYLSGLNPRIKISPVLKSNAYGHGIVEVAKILDNSALHTRSGKLNVPFFCVDSIYEAYELSKAKIKTPILITGYIDPNNLKVKKLPFMYAVWDIKLAEAINKYQPGAAVHVFVDTGMNREGVSIKDLPEFLKQISLFPYLRIEGLMSHLASSSNPIFNKQKADFKVSQEIFKKILFNPKWVHLAASDGIVNRSQALDGTNLARVGLALYGIGTDENLKPVLQFKTTLIQIKEIKKGDLVGYDGTFIAKVLTIVGILASGYNDGVDRRLSNKGIVKIGEEFAPIIGRTSMNITTIDITKMTDLTIGQSVTIFSANPEDKNSIANSAKITQTIPYELLVHLASSTKREIV